MISQRDGADAPGKDMGYPYVRPGLEDLSRWHTEQG
ncbi:Uncharacterised protein [Mycobacteroides abscessus subsp. abscessus]|nr:Uncharacterised protein [Mycobacteroides abscessus subsp. abscessus]